MPASTAVRNPRLTKIVQRCLKEVARRPAENVDVYVGPDIMHWTVALRFTEDDPFRGGEDLQLCIGGFSLYLSITFHDQFPAKPPKVALLSPWANHQHLYGQSICHSMLSSDFADWFRGTRTHETSMWNPACALADEDGSGGMPRYLEVLRTFLGADLDYAEERVRSYTQESLRDDVDKLQHFWPRYLNEEDKVEPLAEPDTTCESKTASWGTDFFLKEALIAGDGKVHPCFDVMVVRGKVPGLSTTMSYLSQKSFHDGARRTDLGTSINVLLPYPCTLEAWHAVGRKITDNALKDLGKKCGDWANYYGYRLGEVEWKFENILNLVGELWKSTCIDIVKSTSFESERAMMCFVNLHFLLLCIAKDNPGIVSFASKSVDLFLERLSQEDADLKKPFPDLGRFLPRFLLTENTVSLEKAMRSIYPELFRRNIRWAPKSCWADTRDDEATKQRKIDGIFDSAQFGMKLTLFQCYYIMRAKEFGLDKIEAHIACQGRPDSSVLGRFQNDFKKLKDLRGYADFFTWLQLPDLASGDIHTMLCLAVDGSNRRGYNRGIR